MMSFDGLMLSFLLRELKEGVLEGRIDKIQQPQNDELILSIRNNGKNYKLLCSANANYARAHFVCENKQSPLVAPMFCMVLRKHLAGGRIIGLEQPNFERVLKIYIESRNEMGDLSVKCLIIEIMGRHSNIILVNSEGIILDSIKHIYGNISSVRQVYAGKAYEDPPSQNKLNPIDFDEQAFLELSAKESDKTKVFSNNYTGISPFSSKMLATLGGSFLGILNGEIKPYIILNDLGEPISYSAFGSEIYEGSFIKFFDSISEMLEYFYINRAKTSQISQKSADLKKTIQNLIDRGVKKFHILQETLKEIENRDELRIKGEVLLANIYAIKKGQNSLKAVNFYSENGEEIEITLDIHKTPAENAQAFFKKYNKQKRTHVAALEQIAQNNEDLAYLEGVLISLENSSDDSDINQIRDELFESNFIKKRPKNYNEQKIRKQKPKPLHFVSDNFDIFVGKNNRQNDDLTFKIANSNDIWLHAKDLAGSHVIIKSAGQAVSEKVMEDAAMLAAFYSKGKNSSLVPIDYCEKKQVKKPSGAKPGMVIYNNYKTIYITPSEAHINTMEKIK